MLLLNQFKMPVSLKDEKEPSVKDVIAKKLRVKKEAITYFEIRKKSLDAREKSRLCWIYSVVFSLKTASEEKTLLKRNPKLSLSFYQENNYILPDRISENAQNKPRPVIIGTGPAGLFCGYLLSMQGYQPLLIERGDCIEVRKEKVKKFWDEEILDTESNIQFGEGGAGTFSDGKLQTQVKDKYGRIRKILEIFVEHGAPEEILYLNKPHIGTDILEKVIQNMRKSMISMGAEFRFRTKFTEPVTKNHSLTGIKVINSEGEEEWIPTNYAVLAIGHSARDTFYSLYNAGIHMENKPFAVGFRIQHPQNRINLSQYGENYEKYNLPVADYKLTYKATSGRGVYSFCMCPGGYVVNASSEKDRLAVNGMSYHDRGSDTANSALVITVDEAVYGTKLFDGLKFIQNLETKAFQKGNGQIPVQYYEDFKREVEGKENVGSLTVSGSISGNFKGKTNHASLKDILPQDLEKDLLEAMEAFGNTINGYNAGDSLLAAVESRTSSPIKMYRDEMLQSNMKGLFPCGEGAGYAGGITSAAMDGLKVAEKIALLYNNA